MKVNIEVDCTPEEARTLMGLPDVDKANAVYVDSMTKAMKEASNPEQLQKFAQQVAPMGQMGLKLFQSLMEGAVKGAASGDKGTKTSKD